MAPSSNIALDDATLSAMIDTMLPETSTPGGLAAGTPQKVQQLMHSWASPQTREAFAGVLAQLDAQSRAQADTPFASLDPAPRLQLLGRFHDAHAGDSAYSRLRQVITTVFFLSETGATRVLAYQQIPGAWQASIPVTADTVAWAT